MELTWKKALAIGLLAVVIVGVLGYGAIYAWFPSTFQTLFAQRQAAQDTVEQTYDADNAINNYEWFKLQEEKINAKKEHIEDTRAQIRDFKELYGEDASEWDWQTKQQYDRLVTTLLGQKQQYENLVAEYNARSSMQNRAVFKDKLPYEFEKKFWTGDIIP